MKSCLNCADNDVCRDWNLLKNIQFPLFIEDQLRKQKNIKDKFSGLMKAASSAVAEYIGKDCDQFIETCGSEFFDKKKLFRRR